MMRIRRHPYIGIPIGLFAIAAAAAQASQTTITISATVVAVPCTATQHVRIRACALAVETISIEPSKIVVAVPPVPGGGQLLEPRYEIRLDPTRPAMIRTVVY